MMPIVDGLAQEYQGEAEVLTLNANEQANLRLQAQWGLRGHPSFAIIDGGGNVSQIFFGPQEDAVLRKAVERVLSD